MRTTLFLLISALLACQLMAQTTFSNRASELGFQHSHDIMVQMGGGVVIFDFNNDQLEDVFLTGGNSISALYQNVGNDSFVDITLAAGLLITDSLSISGAVSGDIDNDGYRDLFLYSYYGNRNCLLRNNGDSTFTDITFSAGVQGDSLWTHSASFGDINRDGFIDLYVGQFIEIPIVVSDSLGNLVSFNHLCIPNQLYLNNGDNTFSDAAHLLNAADTGCALSTIMTDYDLDGDADLLVVNDFGAWVAPNTLYQNNFPNPFINVGNSSGIQTGIYGMGIAYGDYDQDADIDYYATNIGRNVLKRNMGNGQFIDTTDAAGVGNQWVQVDSLQATGWGCGFLDIDNDTKLDLYVSNGYIDAFDELMTSPHDPDKLFHNNGDATFSDISYLLPQDSFSSSRGFAYADYDNDGDLDLFPVPVRVHNSSPFNYYTVYENQLNNGKHWLKIKLIGSVSNRDAYGAKIKMHLGNIQWLHEVSGQGSHCSQHSSIAHFGLDSHTVADSIIIQWPSGHTDRLYQVPSNQFIEYTEGQSAAIEVEILSLLDNQSCNNYNTTLYTNGQYSSYLWSTGDTSHQIDVSATGMYYLTVTSPNQLISVDSIQLTLDFSDSLLLQLSNISCYGQQDGSALLSYAANSIIQQYQWSNGSTNSSLNNLDQGYYAVTVTNSVGCLDSLNFQISSPSALQLSAAISNVDCYAAQNGSIDISPSGGSPPYSFNWSNNSTSEDIAQLGFGNYSLFMVDSMGCTSTGNYFVNAPLSPIQFQVLNNDTICWNGQSGALDIEILGGSPPYQYLWSNGSTVQDIQQLAAGNYQLTVVDSNNCSIVFQEAIISYPPINFQAQVQLDSSNSNGAIILISNDPNLSYNWSNGSTDTALFNLSPGNYYLTVSNAYACSIDTFFNIPLIQSTGQIRLENGLIIYPIPSSDFVYMHRTEGTVLARKWTLYDALGNSVKQIEMTADNPTKISLEELPQGIYYIRATNTEPAISFPILKY
jgi:hypothetical protein